MSNPVDVLRKSVDDYRELLQAGGPLDDAEFADEYAALADVERLVEAVWIAKLEGRFEPLHDAFRPFEEREGEA